MILTLHILGDPVAKQGDRSRIAGGTTGRQFVQHFQSGKVKGATANLRAQIIAQLPAGFVPLCGPLVVHELVFTFGALKSMPKWQQRDIIGGAAIAKTTKPDLDNLEKLLWDACEGIVYANDSLIWEKLAVRKVYGRQPGIRLVIEGEVIQ